MIEKTKKECVSCGDDDYEIHYERNLKAFLGNIDMGMSLYIGFITTLGSDISVEWIKL